MSKAKGYLIMEQSVSSSHFCDSIFDNHCDRIVFFRCSWATIIEEPGQTPCIMRGVWPGPTILVPQLGTFSHMKSQCDRCLT